MLPPRGLARTPTFGCEFSCPSAPRHPFCPRAPPRSPPAAANSSNLAPHDKSSTDPDPAPAHAALSSAHTPRAPSCQRSDNASTALPRSPTQPASPAPPAPAAGVDCRRMDSSILVRCSSAPRSASSRRRAVCVLYMCACVCVYVRVWRESCVCASARQHVRCSSAFAGFFAGFRSFAAAPGGGNKDARRAAVKPQW